MKRYLLLILLLLTQPGCGKGGGGSSGTAGGGGGAAPSVGLVNGRAYLSWNAGSGLPDGYLIEQSTDNATWTQIQTVTETSTYIDGLSAGTKYYFRLRAFNSAGNSAYSGSVSITL